MVVLGPHSIPGVFGPMVHYHSFYYHPSGGLFSRFRSPRSVYRTVEFGLRVALVARWSIVPLHSCFLLRQAGADPFCRQTDSSPSSYGIQKRKPNLALVNILSRTGSSGIDIVKRVHRGRPPGRLPSLASFQAVLRGCLQGRVKIRLLSCEKLLPRCAWLVFVKAGLFSADSSMDGLLFDLFFDCHTDVKYSCVAEVPHTRMFLSERHSKVETTTSSSSVKISPSLVLRMPCQPSMKTPKQRHADASSTRLGPPPLRSKILLPLRRIHRGAPESPTTRRPFRKFNEFRFANFFSGVDIFAACSWLGQLPKLHSSLEVAPWPVA